MIEAARIEPKIGTRLKSCSNENADVHLSCLHCYGQLAELLSEMD